MRDLRIVSCCLIVLPQLRCFSGLTQLCIAVNQLENYQLASALLAMPQLRVLDISRGYDLNLGPEAMLGLVGCCPSLQDMYVANAHRDAGTDQDLRLGEALLDVQRKAPRVRLHLMGAPDYDFG